MSSMICEAQTEQEMRDHKAPTPNTIAELSTYIESLTNREHEYGTCCYAMSLAATAAFNYVASRLGVTGFQASCADLDIIRRTRHIDGPFIFLRGEDMLYPQYNLHEKLREAMEGWSAWAAEQAREKLAATHGASDRVIAHWKQLAAQA